MRVLLFALLLLLFIGATSAKRRKDTNRPSSSDSDDQDNVAPAPTTPTPQQTRHTTAASSTIHNSDDRTIEDVDEDKIDQILHDGTKNLVIFFYDGRAKCPGCSEALTEMEKIDDDLEATGYIEVVRTDDRNVARELGVTTYPALIYFRRKNPIVYDGDYKDSEQVLRWLRAHDEVATIELNDDNFEERTDSYSPDEGSLDWFVMFFDSSDSDCNAFIGAWETVAHKLRGLVHVGRVDISESDDVAERFNLNDEQCPKFLLFHRGKLYRYKDAAKDVRSLTLFALHKFKELRGHRIPEPPTALEEAYEQIKEQLQHIVEHNQAMTVVGVAGLIVIVSITLIIKAYRLRSSKSHEMKAKSS